MSAACLLIFVAVSCAAFAAFLCVRHPFVIKKNYSKQHQTTTASTSNCACVSKSASESLINYSISWLDRLSLSSHSVNS